MKKLKDILNEVLSEATPQTKIFDQGSLNRIDKELRQVVGIEKDETMYNKKVDYSEFRFSDGTGGFGFKWSHSKHRGGNWGLSLRKDGRHKMYAQSWYDKKKFGDEDIPQKQNFLKGIMTWKDLDNLTQGTIWGQLEKIVANNEMDALKAQDQDAKDQRDYYSKKADTGRIGYGLSSQPRRR